jgi:hypothetical protein
MWLLNAIIIFLKKKKKNAVVAAVGDGGIAGRLI